MRIWLPTVLPIQYDMSEAAEKKDFLVRPATLTDMRGQIMKMATTNVWQNKKVPHFA